jgi:ribosomal protein L9
MRRKLMLQFYYLSLVEQRQLVDDWIVERTARQRDRRAQELEESLARKTLAKIKKDMLAVVSNVDYVLRLHDALTALDIIDAHVEALVRAIDREHAR